MEASSAATLMPPIGAGRNWSFAAGTYSIPRLSGTRTLPNLSATLDSAESTLLPAFVGAGLSQLEEWKLSGKVSEFRYLSGQRLFTVPPFATTFVMHEMLREHFQLPVSCLVFFPVQEGLSASAESCPYHVIESTHALCTLEPAEILEAGLSYRRCYLCQDFRADAVDGSDPDAMACEACNWAEWLCASCLMRTTMEGSGLFVHCVLCLAFPNDIPNDTLGDQRVRTQLSALSPSQRAWLDNCRRWLPEDYRNDPEMEEVD